MESLATSIIFGYLKQYINNFKKEQVSTNFFRGQSVIHNVDINVDAINEMAFLQSLPGLKFTRIFINTLSIEANLMSLQSKAITVFIDEIFFQVNEIVELSPKNESNDPNNKSKFHNKYGFLDRIVDSLSFEINRIVIGFCTLGRAKSTSIGDWTPPVLVAEFIGIRYFCTTHNDIEAEIEECMRIRQSPRPILFVYKKLDIKKGSVYLINPEMWSSISKELIEGSDMKMIMTKYYYGACHSSRGYNVYKLIDNLPIVTRLCLRKRLDNNMLLGMELSFHFDEIKMTLKQKVLSEFLHFLTSLFYCFLRDDVIERIYGPDPHNERSNIMEKQLNAAFVEDIGHNQTSLHLPGQYCVSRDHLKGEDLASLDILEAELYSIGVTSVEFDDREERQRSSLDANEDPPHLRLVLALEVDKLSITFPLNDLKKPPSSTGDSTDEFDVAHENDGMKAETIKGITLNITGLLYSSLWPEHAGVTESVLQVLLRTINIYDYHGTQKTCILRTIKQDDGRPSLINLLPRGVKEIDLFDSEILYNDHCYVYKKESNWPPPPIGKGVAIKTEVCVNPLEVTIILDTFCDTFSLIYGSWDSRWITGQWEETGFQRLDKVHDTGSAEIFVLINGLSIVFFPSLSDRNNKNMMLPAQLMVDIKHISLMWKSSLDIKFLFDIFREHHSNQANYNDLTHALQLSKHIRGINLLTGRFEALLTEIVVYVATDEAGKHTNSVPSDGFKYSLKRKLVKPFSIMFFKSNDPHPFRDPIIPTSSLSKVPYNREYYWIPNSSVISTNYLGIDDMQLELSLLDLVKLVQTIDSINSFVTKSSAYTWVVRGPKKKIEFTKVHAATPSDIADGADELTTHSVDTLNEERSKSIEFDENKPKEHVITDSIPSYLSIFHIRNFTIAVTNDSYRSTNNTDIVTGVALKHLSFIVEKPALSNHVKANKVESILIFKGICGSFVVTACNQPFIIITCDPLTKTLVNAASKSNNSGSNWLSVLPVLSLRFDALCDVVDSSISSSEDDENYSAIAEFKLFDGAKIIIIPKKAEEFVNAMLSEVLRGFGNIYTTPSVWYEDSVFGYFQSWLDRLAGMDNTRQGKLSAVTSYQLGKVSSKKNPILFKGNCNQLDIMLVETFTEANSYIGLVLNISDLHLSGQLHVHTSIPLFVLSISLLIKLHLHEGVLGDYKVRTEDITSDPFVFKTDIRKIEGEVTKFVSNLSIQDISSQMSPECLKLFNKIYTTSLHCGLNIHRLILNFWSIIDSSIPIVEGIGNAYNRHISSQQRTNYDNLTATIRVMRSILPPSVSDAIEKSPEIDSVSLSNAPIQESLALEQISVSMTEALVEQYHLLKNIENITKSTSSEESQTLFVVDNMCNQLDDTIEQLKDMTRILAVGQVPSYHGYVKRSGNFYGTISGTISNNTVRSYALLLGDSIYFIPKPYSQVVEFVINLQNVHVIDPNQDENTRSLSISRQILFENDIGEKFVMDVLTLDEKVLWLNALQSWIVIARPSATGGQTKRRGSSISSSLGIFTDKTRTSFDDNCTESMDCNSGEAKRSSTSRLKAATQGMMRSLSMASKSITAPIRELGNVMVNSMDTDSGKSNTYLKGMTSISRSTLEPVLSNTQSNNFDELSTHSNTIIESGSRAVRPSITHNVNEFPSVNPLKDTIIQLEEVQTMLRQNRQFIDTTKIESSERNSQFLNSIRKSYEIIGKSIIGSLTMKVLSSEVRNKVVLLETVSIESTNSLAHQLRNEKMKSIELSQAIMKSEQKEKDIELILQACTMQNIETVHTMSRQYDDLEAQYNLLKTGDSTIAAASELAGNAQELAKHLSMSIKELDCLLKESEEKRLMTEANMHSAFLESSYIIEENKQLKQILSSINTAHELRVNELQNLVTIEQNKSNEIKNENDALKNRLKELSEAMERLSRPL